MLSELTAQQAPRDLGRISQVTRSAATLAQAEYHATQQSVGNASGERFDSRAVRKFGDLRPGYDDTSVLQLLDT